MNKLAKSYALLIGVGKDLPVTVRDAKAIYNIIADDNLTTYPLENITLLTNKKATRQGILDAFDKLIATVDEDSSVFLFYSGHGGTYSDNTFLKKKNRKPESENRHYFHLCPYDYDPVDYETTWIKAEEVKEKIGQLKSRKLIFFLDCCHAAGMTKNSESSIQAPGENLLVQADGLAQHLDDGRGMSIISSCRENQLSYILEGDSNSLYTKCMIEVLKGKSRARNDEPYVRISEVVQYIFKKVPEGHTEQNPYANLQIYDDFILSYVPNNIQTNQIFTESITSESKTKSVTNEIVTKFRETKNSNSVVLFVHGFSGEATNTFSEIPNYLMEDSKMNGWDLFPVGYSGNITPELGKNVWASLDDIKRNSDYLVTSIKHKYSKYKRIALVGHSLGGLVIQQALLDLSSEDRTRISHLLLFATPSGGLTEKAIATLNQSSLKDLSDSGKYIKSLRERWEATFTNGFSFQFKTVAATKDSYIPVTSSLEPFDAKYREMLEGDHFSLVHVSNPENDAYQLIVSSLTNSNFYRQYSNKEEINIALGEYDAVIKNLLTKLEILDSKGLERLVFALEGADRESEALEIIQQHPLAQGNSNLLGILGGRFKRKYLNTFSKEDGKNAFKFYKDALQIAESKGDNPQIYYLAINLAFLGLMLNEDTMEMTEYATKALDATVKDPFPSLWKLATIGEANLYLGEFDTSMDNYSKAASMAGLREKLSIYTNAFNAYTRLMQTDNENDVFIKFLRTNFLA